MRSEIFVVTISVISETLPIIYYFVLLVWVKVSDKNERQKIRGD
jgi:hypothetical protein